MVKNVGQLNDKDYERCLQLGIEGYSDGHLDNALEVFKGLANMRPKDPRPAKMLASTLLLLERFSEAETAYEEALRLDDKDPYTLVALAELKINELKVEAAAALLNDLMDTQEKDHPAVLRGCELLENLMERLGVKAESDND